ncbi:hypothetical protein NECID01_0374 [Nematocida sp. AWRm77]|nr:hypothetical protein NECID01_0374 [Nematocida sp. AWRm77]
MEQKEELYDKETGKLFSNPLFYGIVHYIEKIEDPSVPLKIKQECIYELEIVLVTQSASTSPDVLGIMERFVGLLHVPEMESEVCMLLGYISQNTQPVAESLVSSGVFEEALGVYRKHPAYAKQVLFLLSILSHAVPDLLSLLHTHGATPSSLLDIAEADLDEKSKERLASLKEKLSLVSK